MLLTVEGHLFALTGSILLQFCSIPRLVDITSRLAQMVERKTLNLVVVGSIPTAGGFLLVSLVGQDTRLSPVRPGFKSRTRNIFASMAEWSKALDSSSSLKFEAWVRIPLDAGETAWPSG